MSNNYLDLFYFFFHKSLESILFEGIEKDYINELYNIEDLNESLLLREEVGDYLKVDIVMFYQQELFNLSILINSKSICDLYFYSLLEEDKQENLEIKEDNFQFFLEFLKTSLIEAYNCFEKFKLSTIKFKVKNIEIFRKKSHINLDKFFYFNSVEFNINDNKNESHIELFLLIDDKCKDFLENQVSK